MKRTERHHLKENDIAEWLLGAKNWYEANSKTVGYLGIAVALALAAVMGTMAYRQMNEGKASSALAAALAVAEAPVLPPAPAEAGKPPVQRPGTYPTDRARLEAALPKLLAVADAYPDSDAGIMARYRAAAALVAVGRTQDGAARYKEVVDRGKGAYPVMARLGIAEAHLVAGQFDQAIASFKEVEALKSDDVPVDGVLMQLARAYQLAGKSEDAKKAFKRVVDEFPQSPYAPAARRELEGAGA
ncbi:MAG TPA: tetratricopeptide repeat protein [Vicinamibacterales bacterium]|nr:tetratricopeptide repeat protein [Vicinamibacterales bacterium]